MTKGILKAFLASAVVITFFAALAFAAKGKTVTIGEDSVLPNGQVLKAGNYRVVVDDAGKEVQFWRNKEMVAKHTCKAVALEEKTQRDQLRFSMTPEKKQCLTEIRLAGRNEAYVLETEHSM